VNVLTCDKTSAPDPIGQIQMGATTRLFSPKRTMSLTIALLLVIAFAAAYGMFSVVRKGSFHDQIVAWSTCGMLVFLAITILLIGKYMMQRSLRHIEHQLHTLCRDERMDPIDLSGSGDLQPVMGALSDYVDHVRHQLDHLRLQKKELDIQMRFAVAERRNTEAIIFSISDAVLVIDSYGELIISNTAAEKLFGFRLNEARYRPLERILDDSSLVALLKDARGSEHGHIGRRVEYSTHREGKSQTFNITLSTFIDTDRESQGVVAVFHEITQELELAQAKADFVSSVSHELRTPLSSIKAYVEMLMDNEAHDEKQQREFYTIIQTETERLQRMISNMLNLSRIESSVMVVDREWISPNDVIVKILEMLAHREGPGNAGPTGLGRDSHARKRFG